jgi:transposase
MTAINPASHSGRTASRLFRANRKKRIRHGKEAYKGCNVIERSYCRLKDFRRIATRYDKLARNFFSSVCFDAVVYWA